MGGNSFILPAKNIRASQTTITTNKISTQLHLKTWVDIVDFYTVLVQSEFYLTVSASIILLHHLKFNKTNEEKVWQVLFKDAEIFLNKSWKHYSTRLHLYDYFLPISQIIQIRFTRRAGRRCRCKNELLNEIIISTITHGHTSVNWRIKTYIHQLFVYTNDTDGERERERESCRSALMMMRGSNILIGY